MNRFEETHWSLIAAARGTRVSARPALEQLCRMYRAPVLAYIRRVGNSSDDAEDLTQAFFVHFLEHDGYAGADPGRGRFRSLLLTSLRRFLIDQHHHQHALKRHAYLLGGDAIDSVADDFESPEHAFTCAWLATMLDHAMQHLQEEWAAAGKLAQFEQYAPLMLEPAESAELKAIAAEYGMRSNTIAVQIHRMRQRLRQLVRLEMLQTVGSHEALELELSELRGFACVEPIP